MTINEAVHRIDNIKPNTYSMPEKIKWLSTLDGIIKKQIIDTHRNGGSIVFNEYTEETDLKTQLLVPAPYDDIYLFYLESKIDYWNGEVKKYNNSNAMFIEAYDEFAKYYNRMNMPPGGKFGYNGSGTTFSTTNGIIEITIEEA